METMKIADTIRPMLSQTRNNTTAWVGHLLNDTLQHFSGQTFKCPGDGILENIQVYASLIQRNGDVQLILNEFNDTEKNWGHPMATSSLSVNTQLRGDWITFALPHVPLVKNKTYGFRLQSENAMLGVGEWARKSDEPCGFGGLEWKGDSDNKEGVFFNWFTLAFKVEVAA